MRVRPRALVVALFLLGCGGRKEERTSSPDRPAAQGSIILATTTSTQDSGLLDVLAPRFRKETGIDVKVIAVGSGAALQMGAKGDADVVLSHAPGAEEKLVASGDLVEGRLVMHNDFVIVGPPDDPALVKGAADLKAALAALATAGGFASRGDDSGTHKKELELWTLAGVDARAVARREETGQGMGATLNVADQKNLYTLTDRGTFLALRKHLRLVVVHEGAPELLNVYRVYVVNPERHPRVKGAGARRFAEFLVSPGVQALIGDFRREELGEPLFIADAGKDPAKLGVK